MNNEKCEINFEMSSEEMLGIFTQPNDTCDNNHPLHNSMHSMAQEIRDSVANCPYSEALLEELSYEENDVDLLQESVEGFYDWYKGLESFFKSDIKEYVEHSEVEQYEDMFSRINDKLCDSEGFYLSMNISQIMESQDEYIVDIQESIKESVNLYSCHSIEVEDINSEIIDLQDLIDNDEDEDGELTLKKHELNSILSEKEKNEPWEESMEASISSMDKYFETMNKFGKEMQNHFTDLRKLIDQLKVMIKHHIVFVSDKNNKSSSLSYPNDKLKNLIENHSKKSEIISAGTPGIFIRKLRVIENKEKKLDEDDREDLFSLNEKDALSAAMKRFNFDFPQYKKLLTFKDEKEAKALGSRISISFEEDRENEFSKSETSDFDY